MIDKDEPVTEYLSEIDCQRPETADGAVEKQQREVLTDILIQIGDEKSEVEKAVSSSSGSEERKARRPASEKVKTAKTPKNLVCQPEPANYRMDEVIAWAFCGETTAETVKDNEVNEKQERDIWAEMISAEERHAAAAAACSSQSTDHKLCERSWNGKAIVEAPKSEEQFMTVFGMLPKRSAACTSYKQPTRHRAEDEAETLCEVKYPKKWVRFL